MCMCVYIGLRGSQFGVAIRLMTRISTVSLGTLVNLNCPVFCEVFLNEKIFVNRTITTADPIRFLQEADNPGTHSSASFL